MQNFTSALSASEKRTALWIVCLGVLMIVLDTTIINVALPAIQKDLGFHDAQLAWVVNAYMLSFGGCLLLGGRLGDLYGAKKLFIVGVALFTLASLLCGLAQTQHQLIAARALQGVGGAVADAVGLAILLQLYTETTERAKAMGVFGFVASGGGALGVMLGGVLTQAFGWPAIFLVNLPIGVAVLWLAWRVLPSAATHSVRLDIGGAISITSSLCLLVYAIVNIQEHGWLSVHTSGAGILGLLGLLVFVLIEARVAAPLLPLPMLRGNKLAMAGLVGMLWSAAMWAWFFLMALYLQRVLDYDPVDVGLAFLPANLIMAACSIWFSAKLVLRFGAGRTLFWGMLLVSLSLAWCAAASSVTTIAEHNFWWQILPAMQGIDESMSGMASGIVNTGFVMGGSLGLAILVSISASINAQQLQAGTDHLIAAAAGYQAAFIAGTVAAVLAAGLTWKKLLASTDA